jgi:hypothetical protein
LAAAGAAAARLLTNTMASVASDVAALLNNMGAFLALTGL